MEATICALFLNGLCVVRAPFSWCVYTCVCVAAVWSLYTRCVLKVTVSRGYDGVRVTEELQAMC